MDPISRTAGKQLESSLRGADSVEAEATKRVSERIKKARLILTREGMAFTGSDVTRVASAIAQETKAEENRIYAEEMTSGQLTEFDRLLSRISDPFRMPLIHVADTAYMAKLWFDCRRNLPYTAADVLKMTEMVLLREREDVAAKVAEEARQEARDDATSYREMLAEVEKIQAGDRARKVAPPPPPRPNAPAPSRSIFPETSIQGDHHE